MTYFCEQRFSGLFNIKIKNRNRFNATEDIRVAFSSVSPRISLLEKEMNNRKNGITLFL